MSWHSVWYACSYNKKHERKLWWERMIMKGVYEIVYESSTLFVWINWWARLLSCVCLGIGKCIYICLFEIKVKQKREASLTSRVEVVKSVFPLFFWTNQTSFHLANATGIGFVFILKSLLSFIFSCSRSLKICSIFFLSFEEPTAHIWLIDWTTFVPGQLMVCIRP